MVGCRRFRRRRRPQVRERLTAHQPAHVSRPAQRSSIPSFVPLGAEDPSTALRACAVRDARLSADAHVLDLCTGTADLAIAAVHAAPGARVLGVDFAGAMLRIGLEKLRARALDGRISLVRGDATSIPVRDGWADAATIGFGIRNVLQPDLALTELSRTIKPGGRLVILEFGEPIVPGIRALYNWYFRAVLPRLGRTVSKHKSAYAYLPASVGAFPSPPAFA